MLLADNMLLFT